MGLKHRAITVTRWVLEVAWRARVRFGWSIDLDCNQRVGVVLLSYNREANITPIARSVLKCRFVQRVLISNNHPDKRIADFVAVRSSRLELIDQPRRQRPGIRWPLANEHLGDCPVILAIDDDVFLYPRQIRALVKHVLADPDRVHGFAGFDGHHYVAGSARQVDHVVRAYATTQVHITRYFDLIGRMPETGKEVERIGDDIVLSLAAPQPPMIHPIGHVLSCATSLSEGIAVNQEDDFIQVREHILAEARAHR